MYMTSPFFLTERSTEKTALPLTENSVFTQHPVTHRKKLIRVKKIVFKAFNAAEIF